MPNLAIRSQRGEMEDSAQSEDLLIVCYFVGGRVELTPDQRDAIYLSMDLCPPGWPMLIQPPEVTEDSTASTDYSDSSTSSD